MELIKPPAPLLSSAAKRLAPLMFEMGRLLKRDSADERCSMLHIETLRFISERDAPAMGELALYLRVSKPTVSALVDTLAEDGLLVREADSDDRRKTLVRLTRQGRQTLLGAGRRRERAIEKLFAPLPRRDRAELIRILSFIINRQNAS